MRKVLRAGRYFRLSELASLTWDSLVLSRKPRQRANCVSAFHAAAALALSLIAACASKAPEVRTEYVTVTKDVERIVQVRCEDKRQPLADLPDDDADLAEVSLDDPLAIFRLAQRYVAARLIYRARLKADDEQIKACTGQ